VSGGPATSLHVAIEVIKRAANVTMTYVPYGGTAPAISALMGGHVTAVMADYPAIVSQLRAGSLRPLVTISSQRIVPLPDLPTLTETGLLKYDADIFYGLVAPARTPPAVLSQLVDMFTAATKTSEAKARFEQLGLFETIRCGADWRAYLDKQVEDYARIAREANIKAN
jgi:tripartite-type tricarboxylate transporter receptor subunit TctC